MRRSKIFLVCLLVLVAAFLATIVDAGIKQQAGYGIVKGSRDLVKSLGLTDLALFTEARYTRHPSQTDLYSAFQDHPGAIEHFPTGSLLSPPSGLLR